MNSKVILILGGILSSLVVFLCLKNQYSKPIKPKLIQKQIEVNITKPTPIKQEIKVKPASAETNLSKNLTTLKKDENTTKIEENLTKVEKTIQKPIKKVKIINTKKIQKKINKILSRRPIYFKFGSVKLTKRSKKTLKSIAKLLNKKGIKYTIAINGHTDANGDERYNKNLSKKRAKSVKNYLTKYCPNIKKITSVGYGSSKPKVKNPRSKKNRRVEIIIKRGEK